MVQLIYSVLATDGKRPDLLADFLRSLRQCDIPTGYKGLIIVENNDEPRLSHESWGKTFPFQITYMNIGVLNKSAALNLVIDTIDNALLYFHDDDVELSENALTAMAEASKQHPEKAFFGGPLAVRYQEQPPEWLKPYLPNSAKGWQLHHDSIAIHNKPEFLGGNWAARIKDLREIGGFLLSLGPSQQAGGEEKFAQEQLLAAGCSGYYVPEACATHYVPREKCSQEFAWMRTYRSSIFLSAVREKSLAQKLKLLIRAAGGICYDATRYSIFKCTGQEEASFKQRFAFSQKLGMFHGLLSSLKATAGGDR